MSEYLIPIGIMTFLILVNALFVAAEFAIVSAPYSRIANLADQGSRTAHQVIGVLRDPRKSNHYIATAQIGITVASLGLGMYGEHTIADWLVGPLEHTFHLSDAAAHTLALISAIAILTYLHVVVGEMVPKSLAIQYSEASVLRLSAPMTLIGRIFSPIVVVLNNMGDAITRMLGVPPAHGHERLFSAEELEFIVEESFVGGKLDPTEQLYLENIFDFQERAVYQVMTPRTRIVGLPVNATEAQVLQTICQARNSRYPVYSPDMDHILGVLHVKTLARQQVNRPGQFDLRKLLRQPLYVPESVTLNEMRNIFREKQVSLAIVLDEYGGTAGLVTVEDLVEEVVGEILDEFDQELPPMQDQINGSVRVRGDLILGELDQHYDLSLDSEEVDTVGGLIMTILGRVPEVGDVAEQDGVVFTVESVDGMAVKTAMVDLPSDDNPDNVDPGANPAATLTAEAPSSGSDAESEPSAADEDKSAQGS